MTSLDKFVPTAAHRTQWALATTLALLFAAGSTSLLLLTQESMHTPGGVGDGALAGCVIVFLVSVFAMGASLGLAVVPKRVAERGHARAFSLAMGLAVTGLLFAYPTPLLCFTGPIAGLMLIGAGALFVRTWRAP